MNRKSQTQTNNKPRSEKKVLGFNSFVSFVKTDRVNCSSVCDSIHKNSSLELIDQLEFNEHKINIKRKQELLLSRLDSFNVVIISLWIDQNRNKQSEVILK